MKIFVDSSAWIAFFDETDDFHQRAKDFLATPQDLITSNIVFHEFVAHLENRISKRVAEKAAEVILSGKICELVYMNKDQEIESLKEYKKTGKKISFVDVSNKIVMRNLDIKEIFAFDRDFEKLGLMVVPD